MAALSDNSFDVIVIGGGIAGASCAAALSKSCRVLLLERETQAGYHSTGRSAAIFVEFYGNTQVRALSRASRSFLFHPPADFASAPLVQSRGSTLIATESQRHCIDQLMAQEDVARICRVVDTKAAIERCPLLRPDKIVAAVVEDDSCDIDVHELLQGYLRVFKARGGRFITNAQVASLNRSGAVWRVTAAGATFDAPTIVNAAGAWADQVALMADVAPLGLSPKRRTAAIVTAPDDLDVNNLSMIIDIEEQFYLKPDAGRLLVSPADETPSEPCDAQPEDIDVAIAVDRIEAVTHLQVKRVPNRWAGLRTFAPDKSPVVGFDPRTTGFFWLAGQGGYGIQTAPAMSELAAGLILAGRAPARLIEHGLIPSELAPDRLLQVAAAVSARVAP